MEVEYVRVYGNLSDQEITALDKAYPLAKNVSRVSSVRIFWNAARNIAGLPKVEA